MMKKSAAELKTLYTRILSAFEILICISLFLPWVSVSNKAEHVSFSGIGLLEKGLVGLNGNSLGSCFGVLVLSVPVLFLLAALVLQLLKNESSPTFTVAAFVVSSIGSILMLFSAKKLMDGSGFFQTPIMVGNLSFGFWAFFILSIVGLFLAMRVRKLSRGYVVLVVLSVIWLFPIVWIVLTSFRAETGFYYPYFIPQHFTLDNYVKLLTDTSLFFYKQWYLNTLIVAIATCLLGTFIVLCTAFVVSRLRFSGRKTLFSTLLVLGMFPNFMAVFAVYYIIKGIGISGSLAALVLVLAAGAAVNLLITKGFYDTIPRSVEEAACIDGATKWNVFTKITIPLSKPIIIYTILYYFIMASSDIVSSTVILGNDYHSYTLAVGMYQMLQEATVDVWFTRFAAGSVLISIPICVLFIFLQKYYVDGISGAVKG